METFTQYMANEAARAKTHEYSCVMIDLPLGLSREITAFGRRIPQAYIFDHPEDKSFGREKDPHVTVLYGIHTEKATRIRKVVKDTERFTLKLGKMSLFENDKMDVLKIEVVSNALIRLNATLRDRLYHTQTHPEYRPHVTIAYLKKGKGEKFDGDKTFDGREFDADKLVFSPWKGEKTSIKLKLGAEWSLHDH